LPLALLWTYQDDEMFRYLTVFFLLFLGMTGCAARTAPQAPPAGEACWLDGLWPHEKSALARHDRALYGRLPNGFRYIIQPNRRPEGRVTVHLDVQVGSLMERDDELGIAHFLEHLAFNGSRHFAAGELIPFFQANGMAFGRDLNAHTSDQETVFKLNLANTEERNLDTALTFLRDVADGIRITREEVDKERGVILSEKAARDSIRHRAGSRLRAELYRGTRFTNETIGEEAIIRTASPATIENFYWSWYRPELMILVVVGQVDPAAMEKRIAKAFGDFTARTPRRRLDSWGDIALRGPTFFHDHHAVETTTVRISALHPRIWENDSLDVQRAMLRRAMACRILSRRLQKLKASGNAPFIMASASQNPAFNLLPSAHIVGSCQKDKWQETLAVLQDEVRRTLQYGFLPEEVEQIKAETLRSFEQRAKNAVNLPNDLVAKYMVGCLNGNRVYQSWEQTLELYRPLLDEATPQNLHDAFAAMWRTENRFVAVTGNADIGADAEATLAALYREGQKRPARLLPAVEKIDYPYLPVPRQPGRIVSRRQVPVPGSALTLHESRFANGLLMRMLPTPFLKGEFSMTLHVGGGLDAVDDDHYIAAKLAFMADAKSGFGRLTAEEAGRLRRTTGYDAQSRLERHSTEVAGGGETDDMAGIVEAMWTQYRAPAITNEDRRNMLRALAIADARRGKDVPSVIREMSPRYFRGDALRTRPVSSQQGKEVALQALQSQLRQGHQGGRPVVNIVGDFIPAEAEKIMARFFGADEVSFADAATVSHAHVPCFPQADDREKTLFVDTNLNQAALRMSFLRRLEDVTDRQTLMTRRLLAAIAGDRLRVRVREELGATYSPSMRYRLNDDNGHGDYFIRIATQPEQLPRLKAAVQKVLETLRTNGVSLEEINRQRRPMIAQWQRARKQNGVYMQLLDARARRDRPYLEWAAKRADLLNAITVEDINRETHLAFDTTNMALLVATENPENKEEH
jgi:zinc protease